MAREGGFPVAMCVCVGTSEPSDEVPVIEIEAEEGTPHEKGAAIIDGRVIRWWSRGVKVRERKCGGG